MVWVHLYALDPQHPGLPLALTPGRYEVEDATVSGDGRAMVYAANDTLADLAASGSARCGPAAPVGTRCDAGAAGAGCS